ncbi:hypothetical protein RvY_04312 [Ramazzottius varieornatus]|uniref:Protein sleepless n=1 Tax=Ramazzottius varieornatus TaxID=947166 RepID=A0A1D1UR81_RAMVA|nr:hypothetical protein RvY_04312 [Ramazzottius varieornatus]
MYPDVSSLQRILLCTSVLLLSLAKYSRQIDCYVCSSFSESDPLCEDPFDPIASHHAPAAQSATYNYHGQSITPSNGSYLYLQRGCYGARKARLTAFPATACLKLAGYFTDTGDRMVVRACALDGGSLTSDTEIVRQNHCGGFFLNERYVRGCLEACFTDGCNRSSRSASQLSFYTLLLISWMITGAYLHHGPLTPLCPL